jgi:GNAT superfamily N-acetyltransferase
MPVEVRRATPDDVAALTDLIAASVDRLQAEDYSEAQRQAALGSIFGVDPVLIADGTYFVVELDGEICGCGGWSRRATPFGSDRSPARDDRLLDPARDAARIRALFVHPSRARLGIGSRLLKACEEAAKAAGFRTAELTATLTGVKLFSARGFMPVEELSISLANGGLLPVVRMAKELV